MNRTTIDLDAAHHERLVELARASGRSLEEVVCEAVAEYIVRHVASGSANGVAKREAHVAERRQLTPEQEADWRRHFEELLARIRAGVPDDVTPEEIERDITLASEEARFERIVRRAASDSRLIASE